MSSIISDIFYGSKQNILDNYLVNRHINQQSSLHRKQETVSYSSFIQLVIQIPKNIKTGQGFVLRVEAEMGNRYDEVEVQIKTEKTEVVLTIKDVQKQDLNKFTNIKLTISEEGYNKIHGFIPIEIVKSIANSFSNEKTISVQLKGKSTLPLSSVQCTIRTEFSNNNILNSEILRSMEKEHESNIRSKHQISRQYKQNPLKNNRSRKKMGSDNSQMQSSNNRSFLNKNQQSSNMIIIDEKPNKNHKQSKRPQAPVTEYIKQISEVKILFTKIDLIDPLKQNYKEFELKIEEKLFKLNQIVCLSHLTKKGISAQVISQEKIVGTIHVSPLLLTLSNIYGELPIYSPLEQCLGTIIIQSPLNNHIPNHKPKPSITVINQKEQKSECCNKEILTLSIDKIILVSSNDNPDKPENEGDYFDFGKMEASNKTQVLVRLKQFTHKFNDVVLHYNIDRQNIRIVELKRKQGFKLNYFQQDYSSNQITVEIEIFSASRLVSYGKTEFDNQSFAHKFLHGDSNYTSLYCGIYIKLIRLQTIAEYFQQKKIETIFDILSQVIDNKILFNELDDQSIKRVMNAHKNITYVELKKLTTLFQKNFKQLRKFQKRNLCTVFKKQTPQTNSKMIKLAQRLLQQFLYISNNKQKGVSQEQFQRIMEFYKEDLQYSLGQVYKQFVKNPVIEKGNFLFVFFVAGFYFIDSQLKKQQGSLSPNGSNNDELFRKQKVPQDLKQNNPLSSTNQIKVSPSYFVCSIDISNAHLLNMGKAPNISLNLARNVCYSNSNPHFNIQKEINLVDSIRIFHKSIAEDRLVLLAQFQPLRRQTYYELQPTGKCFAKITWGL